MVLALLTFDFVVIEGSMLLAVARELVRTGVRMVMTLQDNINLIGIVNRRELRAHQDTIGIGVVEARAVDVLVHDDDTPFRIRMSFDGLLDEGFMVGCVVVVGVDDDEQGIAVRVIVAMAGLRRVGLFRERIWYVEVVLISRRHAVMVADARCFRQAAEGFSREIAGVLRFLQMNLSGGLVFCRLVNLVARGDEEVDFRMLGKGAVEGLIPVVSIVARCEVAVLFVAFRRGLTFRSTNLRVADVHEGAIIRIARLEGLGIFPLAVNLDLIVIRRIRFEVLDRSLVRVVLRAVDDRAFFGCAEERTGVRHICILGDADFGSLGFILGIPAEVHLGGIFAGSNRDLLKVCLDVFPARFPLFPVLIAGLRGNDRFWRRRSIVPMLRSGKARRSDTECSKYIGGKTFFVLEKLHGHEVPSSINITLSFCLLCLLSSL